MMRTVPTLCATGSIVGAAGVGFTFGQSPSQPTNLEYLDSVTPTSNRGLHTPSPPSRRPFPFSGLATSSASASRSTTPQSLEPGLVLHSIHPETDRSSSVFGDCGVESESSSGQTPADRAAAVSLKRQPSRLQRLASFTFSLSSSPSASTGPDSKSVALSSGSAAPFIPRESQSSPLPPNKLVKRSLSQHLVNRPIDGDSVKKQATLDRPATRHKRLATLSRRSRTEDESATSNSPPLHITKLHRPFFRPKVPKDRTSATFRQPRGPGDNNSIRRIYPDSLNLPVLVLADSVSPTYVEVDTSLPIESDTFVFGTRPSTPLGIVQFFSSPGPPPSHQTEAVHERRRSFSIADLLSSGPSARNPPRKIRSSKGRRITSAPTFSMHDARHSDSAQQSQKRRDIGTSKASMASGSKQTPKTPSKAKATTSPSTAKSPKHGIASMPAERASAQPQTPLGKDDSPTSNNSISSVSHPSRNSASPSENTSSQVGSDFESKVFSSGDEDDGDKQSDSVYDSLRTGATRSSSGFRGPALETLFDKEAARIDHPEAAASLTASNRGPELHSPVQSNAKSNIEEEGSNSTPARTVIPDGRASRRSSENNVPRTPTIASSPPPIPEPLSLGALEWDSDLGDDEHSWSEDDEEDWDSEHSRKDFSQDRSGVQEVTQNSAGRESSSRSLKFFRPQRSEAEPDQKSNLFDWSEQQPVQRGLEDRPPPRPKTVHGKKNPGGRGSRSSGRRAPSGLHARSQSVPVLADLVGSRTPITSKFGTWGIGSKGVTEDWNEDFEFDDNTQLANVAYDKGQDRTHATGSMVVPETIKAQQTNVLANIGLLKEWGLLIEELKELRERSISLNLNSSQHADIFDEVDAMIDLADQEADDEGLPSHKTPTHSPGVDFEGLELASSSPAVRHPIPSDGQDDIFGPSQANLTSKGVQSTPTQSKDTKQPVTRSRKNSEAIAQTVIQALQSRGKAPGPTSSPRTPPRKVPFDTTTLRHIVPYVNSLSKKMKQVLREAEGLHSSPKQQKASPDPPFRQAFIEPSPDTSDSDRDDQAEQGLVSQMTSTTIHE